MRLACFAAAAGCLLAAPVAAQMMMMPPLGTPPAAAPPAAEASGAETPRPAGRPRRPGPPASIVIVNATASSLTEVAISADEIAATLAKPLPPKGRATLKLPRFKTCLVTVAVAFEDGVAEPSEIDICKEKQIRITE